MPLTSYSPSSFYRKPPGPSTVRDSKRRKRLREAENALKVLDISIGEPLRDPEDFHVHQQTALDRAKELGVSCFSEELTDAGQRRFIAGHPVQMWRLISRRKRGERHFYEIIKQGERCKLYFDLEYLLEENPDSSGERSLREFVEIVRRKIEQTFGRRVSDKDVMDLDSSTETKFSRHLIVDIPGAIFVDNIAVGNFVRRLCDDLTPEERDLFSFMKDGEKKLFVDLGVYTKNRNFRLFKSSKYGKTAVLQLTDESKKHFGDVWECVFLKSLVAYVPDATERVTLTFGYNNPPATVGFRRSRDESHVGTPSLFPEIDDFIMSKMEASGKIRKIIWKQAESTLEYYISGYRYCERIRRCHTSNNIIYVVLLNRGIYFQTCFDEECRDFKSEDLNIPDEFQPWKNWKVEDFK